MACNYKGCCKRRSVTVIPVAEVTVTSNVLERTKTMLMKRRGLTHVLPTVNVSVSVNSKQSREQQPTDSGETSIDS